MTPRTSLSHPLQIAEVATKTGGRIGLTFCPGKKQNNAASGSWNRDLALDLDAIQGWGAKAVVTLVESRELRELSVEGMPGAVVARGMVWHHLPIRDVSVPDHAFEIAYQAVQPTFRALLKEGGAILLHCKGGLGRTGLLAARLLVETGHKVDDAIATVREVRPGAIETDEQEAYVRARSVVAHQRNNRSARKTPCDWFEKLTGFPETSYEATRKLLGVVDGRLQADGHDRGFAVGSFSLPSVAELRTRTRSLQSTGRPKLSIIEGDVRSMHAEPANAGALFQVASQFNMLEMVGPGVTPEEGVTRYQHDRTQGPACAMAAGAATIYRNYLVPVDGIAGQTATRQLNGLADLGIALSQLINPEDAPPWVMSNGYAMATREGLAAIDTVLRKADVGLLDELSGLLRVGMHANVEVTDEAALGQMVHQVFCSALPVAYAGHPASAWTQFARLVLEGAYEATLRAGVLNAARGNSNRVLLTRLGGGAFGNADEWIDDAIAKALNAIEDFALDVVLVSYGTAPRSLRDFVAHSGFVSSKEHRRSARPSLREVPARRIGAAGIAGSALETELNARAMNADALRALAQWQPTLLSDEFTWGQWRPAQTGQVGWFEPSLTAVAFVEDVYRHGWVYMGWNWSEWAQTDEAKQLRDNPRILENASAIDLGRLLTACIRSDRFCEGALAEAYHTGLLTRIVARAAVLAT